MHHRVACRARHWCLHCCTIAMSAQEGEDAHGDGEGDDPEEGDGDGEGGPHRTTGASFNAQLRALRVLVPRAQLRAKEARALRRR